MDALDHLLSLCYLSRPFDSTAPCVIRRRSLAFSVHRGPPVINVSIARRYARALIAVALEKGRVDEVLAELETMVRTVAGSPELQDLFQSPGFSKKQRLGIIDAFAEKKVFAEPTVSFFRLLVERGRTEHIEQIARIYRQLADESAGRVRAEVHTPRPLEPKDSARLKEALAKITGKKIQLDAQVDETLIGGMVAKVGDRVFDGSVRTQLENIRKAALS